MEGLASMAGTPSKRQKDLYCPICGEFNRGREVFVCPECGLDLICPAHRDSWLMVCSECSSLIRSEPFEKILLKLEKETPPGMALISPGNFVMGRDDGEPNCAPSHVVRLPAYYIDEHPVTNEEYKKLFPDYEFEPGFEREPVKSVTWLEARKYAELAGKRLPREVEWEKAVRGVDGNVYPWGNKIPEGAGKSVDEFAIEISSMSESPFGVIDGVGGVREWVEDWYEPYPGNRYNDPAYGKSHKVMRGGNWSVFQPVSAADRRFALPDDKIPDAGFRCVKDTSLVFDYDISMEREREEKRVKNLVLQIKIEKAAREKEKQKDRIILHDKRITELEDALARLKEKRKVAQEKVLGPSIFRKLTYFLSGFWESLLKASGSRRDLAVKWVQILVALVLVYLFFSNVFIKEKVAFTIFRDGQEYIAISGASGKTPTILEGLGPATDPEFSSDGRHLAFVREIDGQKEVFVSDADGKNEVNISNHPSNDTKPLFAPNGRIMWLSDRDNSSNLYVSRVDGSDQKLIPIPSGELSTFDISPNGKKIVFSLKASGTWAVYTMDIDGSDVRQITQNPKWNDRDPVFTLNGRKILFSSYREGNYELFYMGLDGSHPYRVTYSVGDEIGNHAFSRNGRWIYSEYRDGTSESVNKKIYRIRWDGRIRSEFYKNETGCYSASTSLKGFKRFFNKVLLPRYRPGFPKLRFDIFDGGKKLNLGAKARWFKSDIILVQGDYLEIKSYGIWRSGRSADTPWVSPDGMRGTMSKSATLSGEPVGILIASIGDSEPFQVGENQSFITDHEGELRLMMNDTNQLSDNKGMIEVVIRVKSNKEHSTREIPSFKHMKYYGFDDGLHEGASPEDYLGSTKLNLVYLSQDKIPDLPSVIRSEIESGRSVLLEPSGLYKASSQSLDKSVIALVESFKSGSSTGELPNDQKPVQLPIPPFAFYLPLDLPQNSQISSDEIKSTLRKHFPGMPIVTEVTSEYITEMNVNVARLSKFDCLIVDLPARINSGGKATNLEYLPSYIQIPIELLREMLPEMPLMMGIPIEESQSRLALNKEQITKIIGFYDEFPQVVGVVLQGANVNEDLKKQIALLSASISDRSFPVDTARKNLTKQNPLKVRETTIGGDKPYNGLFRGLEHDKDNAFLTCDRLAGIVLKIGPDGTIIDKSYPTLPDGTILNDITGLFVDRNERVIVLDAHPGTIVIFDDSLDYSQMMNLPGEAPGGIAGIVTLVRDDQDNYYTISDDGDLLQKFDKNFNLVSWVGGTSLYPGYFLSLSDAAIGPRGSIYTVDRTKPYIQKFTPDLQLETIIPLPSKDTFFNPTALFVIADDAGSIYVVEKRTKNVYRYSPSLDLVGFFELPAVPSGGIEVTSDGQFHTIINGKLVSYDLNKETPPPAEIKPAK
jgi:sulfatase modifying factor 1